MPNIKTIFWQLPYLDLTKETIMPIAKYHNVKVIWMETMSKYQEVASKFVGIMKNSPTLSKVIVEVYVLIEIRDLDFEQLRMQVKRLLWPLKELGNVQVDVEVRVGRLLGDRSWIDPNLMAYGNSLF
jgi:hypothetical protein